MWQMASNVSTPHPRPYQKKTMVKKTYGVPRLVDWVAHIKAGAASVRVHFTGGALTQYGVTPAEYTTDSPFLQRVIEQSDYFKEGRIILIRKSETPEQPKANNAPHPNTPVEESVGQVSYGGDHTEPMQERKDAATTKVEAGCLQDAQAYLQEKFGIPSYRVRSYDAAQQVALEHGVQFVGAKFDAINGIEQHG